MTRVPTCMTWVLVFVIIFLKIIEIFSCQKIGTAAPPDPVNRG